MMIRWTTLSGLWLGLVSAVFFGTPSFVCAAVEGASVEITRPSAWNELKVDLFGWTHSSGLGNFDGRRPKADGTAGGPVEIVNQIAVSYPTNLGLRFVVVPQFAIRPLALDAGQSRVYLQDPSVGLTGTLVEKGPFSWWTRMEGVLPASDASQTAGKVIQPQMINSFTYKLGSTGLKLEWVVIPSVSFYSNGQADSYLFMSPRVYYSVSDAFQFLALSELGFKTDKGKPLFALQQDGHSSLGLGFQYSAGGFFARPFLETYPFGTVDERTLHVGMMFGGSLK